jgi:hypothetical protein
MTPRDPLLLEVAAAVGAGRIRFRTLASEDFFVHGMTEDNGRITINPAPEIVDTLVHECLHRLRPTWSERAVKAKTTRLMKQLSDAEVEKLFELVLVSAQLHKST